MAKMRISTSTKKPKKVALPKMSTKGLFKNTPQKTTASKRDYGKIPTDPMEFTGIGFGETGLTGET